MTSFTTIKDHLCAVCKTKQDIEVLRSTSQFAASDLDGRPSEMARSTMQYWVQTCPKCGYCAKDLSVADQQCYDIVKSLAYKQQLTDPNFPELANKFLCEAIIYEIQSHHLIAANSYIRAAWSCDDEELVEQAIFCRNKAIDLIQKATPKQHLDQRYKIENEVLVDLLRRAKRFSQAMEVVESSLNNKKDYLSLRILKFQKQLIKAEDPKSYTTEDATGPIKKAYSFSKLADYISDHYYDLLNKYEKKALNTDVCTDQEGHHWLSDEPKILNLLANGVETLAKNIEQKLISEYPNKVVINRCPKCNELARTPKAKQCRYCCYDWH